MSSSSSSLPSSVVSPEISWKTATALLMILLTSNLHTMVVSSFTLTTTSTTHYCKPGLTFASTVHQNARKTRQQQPTTTARTTTTTKRLPFFATVADQAVDAAVGSPQEVGDRILATMSHLRQEARDYANSMVGFTPSDAAFYAIFRAIRECPDCTLGMLGTPFVLRHAQTCQALQEECTTWPGFFTMKDLEKAVTDDFLDAARGSTDNRKGWKITDVSQPRGQSFEEARMTFEDIQIALDKGTVIFNAAGAHIPKLAPPSLACTDATTLPCALNLYITAPNKRTSAPPHTDKQDVVVVQTNGRKYWRVYAPPDPALKPMVDVFSRGKMEDSLPLYSLDPNTLLIETTLNPGDVIFIPAGFPHTTSTIADDDAPYDVAAVVDGETTDGTSIHMTLGVDHHIWELDYVNARRLALRRAGVVDTALGQTRDEDNPFEGKVNELPEPTRSQLLAEFPLGLLEEDDQISGPLIEQAASELERLSFAVDEKTAAAVDPAVWKETIIRFRQEGMELLEIHRDMYLAAIEEGEKRHAEDAMTAHLEDQGAKRKMSPERIQRLSLFRVKQYYDKINESKASLAQWSYEGKRAGDDNNTPVLPNDWAITMPVKVGDEVEADLGGAFFPAKVTRATGGTFDVQFFDGDQETNLDRSQIKLTTPPSLTTAEPDVDTSNMTPKQLKRWKKQQEKLNKK